MNLKYREILVHLILSVSFLMIPYVFIADEVFRFPDIWHSPHDRFTVAIYIMMLGFFYFNYYYLLPAFYLRKRVTAYFAIISAILVLLISYYYWMDFTPPHTFFNTPPTDHPRPFDMQHDMSDRPPFDIKGDMPPHPRFPKPAPMSQLSQLLFLYIIGILVSLFARVSRNLKKIESEKNKTALVYLKSQINPHFLFNTFNSIYGLAVKERADKTANGMLKLSGMLRYVLTETESDFVSLAKEIDYINNYVELQRLRMDASTNLRYTVTGDISNKLIAPMLLIPFIENAFKYGINPGVASDILVAISLDENKLQMIVSNKKTVEKKEAEKLGIGLDNTRSRLELLYPLKYSLHILENETDYSVTLKLNLS